MLDGVRIHAVTEPQCIDHILDELHAGRGGTVVTPNVDHLRRCGVDPQFRAIVAGAEVAVADGMPLVWASGLQGTPLPQRVAGSDLISSLAGSAARSGRSIYLLGGNPGTAEAAARALEQRFPLLQIAGFHCPPYADEQDPQALPALRDLLLRAGPDIVFVALGSPKQEHLIARLRPTFLAPGGWAWGTVLVS